jgi:hypothetical protein
MALSEKTINKHNIRRAEVFAANGLGDHDVALASPSFSGHMAGGDVDCCLCDHRHIAWQYEIKFAAPDAITAIGKVATGLIRTEEVTLQYVGSKCIKDWLDAIPESMEKLELLKKWHAAMSKCNEAKTAKVVADLCKKAGYETPSDAYDAYAALPWNQGPYYTNPFRVAVKQAIGLDGSKQLRNNRFGIKNSTSSRGTVKKWLTSLAKVVAVHAALPAPAPKAAPVVKATPKPVPAAPKDDLAHLKAEDKALLLEARTVFIEKKDGCWNGFERGAIVDIAKKVKQYGSFASGKQRGFFQKLLKLSAPKVEEKAEAPTTSKPVLGDADYASKSGVDGARY